MRQEEAESKGIEIGKKKGISDKTWFDSDSDSDDEKSMKILQRTIWDRDW